METLYFTGSEITVEESTGGRYGGGDAFLREAQRAGLDPDSEVSGIAVRGPLPTMQSTLARLENPLSSDSAYYLRAWMRQFPTGHDRRRLRDLRDQFLARFVVETSR